MKQCIIKVYYLIDNFCKTYTSHNPHKDMKTYLLDIKDKRL